MPTAYAKSLYSKSRQIVSSFSEAEYNYRMGRLILCLICAVYFYSSEIEWWSKVDGFFFRPISAFQFFGGDLNDYLSYSFLYGIKLITAGLFVIFAFKYRSIILSLLLFFTTFFVAGYPNNFFIYDPVTSVIMILTTLLVISDGALSFKLDKESVFRWLLQAAQVFVVLMYLVIGIAQLRDVGLNWFTSDNLEVLLLLSGKPFGQSLTAFPVLLNIFAFLVLVLNLSSPLALFLRGKFALIYPTLWIGFQSLAYFSLNLNMPLLSLGVIFFIPWSALVHGFKEPSEFKVPEFDQNSRLKFVTFGLAGLIWLSSLTQIAIWPIVPFDLFNKNVADESYQRVELYSHFKENQKEKVLKKVWTHPLERRQLNFFLSRRIEKSEDIKEKTLLHLERLICKNLRLRNRPRATFPLTITVSYLEKGRDIKTQKPETKIVAQKEIRCAKFRASVNTPSAPEAAPESPE